MDLLSSVGGLCKTSEDTLLKDSIRHPHKRWLCDITFKKYSKCSCLLTDRHLSHSAVISVKYNPDFFIHYITPRVYSMWEQSRKQEKYLTFLCTPVCILNEKLNCHVFCNHTTLNKPYLFWSQKLSSFCLVSASVGEQSVQLGFLGQPVKWRTSE